MPEALSQIDHEHSVIEPLFDYQDQIDHAVKSGDFDRALLLQRLKPDLRPSKEVAQNAYDNALRAWQRDRDAIDAVETILEISGEPLDHSTAERILSTLIKDYEYNERLLEDIKTLKATTKVSFSPEVIQEKYRQLLKNNKRHHPGMVEETIIQLRLATGIDMDRGIVHDLIMQGQLKQARLAAEVLSITFTSEMADQAFLAARQQGGLVVNAKWMKENDYLPPEEMVKVAYSQILITAAEKMGNWRAEIEELYNLTQIEPSFFDSDIEVLLEAYLENGRYGGRSLEGIEEVLSFFQIRLPYQLAIKRLRQKVFESAERNFLDDIKKAIETEFVKLEALVGEQLALSEDDLQEAYSIAIENKKVKALIGLYQVFGVRPQLSHRKMQEFMAEFLDNQYDNPISMLEEVFGVKFKLPAHLAKEKIDEALTKHNFEYLRELLALSDITIDKHQLQIELFSYAQNCLSKEVGGSQGFFREKNWLTYTKDLLADFSLSFTEDQVRQLFQTCTQRSGYTDYDCLKKVTELTGQYLFSDLAEELYTSVLKSEAFSTIVRYSKKIEELSNGLKPVFDHRAAQTLYFSMLRNSCMASASFDVSQIEQLIDFIQVPLRLSTDQIRKLFELILEKGRLERIPIFEQLLEHEFFPEEFEMYVTTLIEDELKRIADDSDFSPYRFSGETLHQLTDFFNPQLNQQLVADLYREALFTGGNYFVDKLKLMQKITDFEFNFEPEEIDKAVYQLLMKGKVEALEELHSLIDFSLSESEAYQLYAIILNSAVDESGEFNDKWLDTLTRIKELSGFGPNEEQLFQIVAYLEKGGGYIRYRTENIYLDIHNLLQDKLDVELDWLKQEVVLTWIKKGDAFKVRKRIEEGFLKSDIPQELLIEACDALLRDHRASDIKLIIDIFKLDYLPLSNESVWEKYRAFLNDESFGDLRFYDTSNAPIELFYELFELTHIMPNFTQEEISIGYRKIFTKDWNVDLSRFQEVVGWPPSEADIAFFVEKLLSQDSRVTLMDIGKFNALHNLEFPQETVDDFALNKLATVNVISDYLRYENFLMRVTQKTPQISAEAVEFHTERFLRVYVENSELTENSFHLYETLKWYMTQTGSRPPQYMLNLAYACSFGKNIFEKAYLDDQAEAENKGKYIGYWQWLHENFGPPDEQVFQLVYVLLINSNQSSGINKSKEVVKINKILKVQEFSSVQPSIHLMAKAAQEFGFTIDESTLNEKLLQMLDIYIKSADLEDLQLFDETFVLLENLPHSKIQELYVHLIFEKDKENGEKVSYIRSRAGVMPHPDIIQTVLRERIETLDTLSSVFGSSPEIFSEVMVMAGPALLTLSENFEIASFGELAEFANTNRHFFKYIVSNPDLAVLLSKTLITNSHNLFSQDPLALELALRSGFKFDALSEDDFPNLITLLEESHPSWSDRGITVEPFLEGAKIFGYEKMFKFIARKELTPHDALHAFDDVLELYEISGLTAKQFYNNILLQVSHDDSRYEEGTAHHHFNSLAMSMNKDISKILEDAQAHSNIDYLNELVSSLSTPEMVFGSWRNLKRYSQLEHLLQQTAILEQLAELKNQGKHKLYQYVSTLAFHPDSKVNQTSVLDFWLRPKEFLSESASHTRSSIHEQKKPSNYIHIPFLDLTAEDLRDALVEGDMDSIAAFKAFEISYQLPIIDGQVVTDLQEVLSLALGSHKKKIEGKARNSKKLFHEINTLLASYEMKITDLFNESLNIEEELEQRLLDLVYDSDFGIPVSWQPIITQIHLKSDVIAVLSGNDTVTCMPFGDGKNTVYTFNLNTGQMTVQIVRDDGVKRTIAQSVITKDKDIGVSVPKVLTAASSDQAAVMKMVDPDKLLKTDETFLTCDNIEVAPNWQRGYEKTIETVYRDFYSAYVAKYAESQGFNADKVVVGQSYTDTMRHLPEEENTFLPQAPVSYSDNTGENVFVLKLDQRNRRAYRRSIREVPPERVTQPSIKPTVPGLDLLTYEDSLAVAYIEQVAYQDNPTHIQNLADMENALIAMQINNAHKGRPHMSLKYQDPEGKVRGYLLAYEGDMGRNDYVNYPSHEQKSKERQPGIYISDLAADLENQVVGGKLIKGFVELYRKNYLEQGNMMPVFMEAREQTSYRILQRQFERVSRDLGIQFEVEELPTFTRGNDTMHPVIIRPVHTETT